MLKAGSWFDVEHNCWVAKALHFAETGETREEALSKLRTAIDQWVKWVREEGDEVTFSW